MHSLKFAAALAAMGSLCVTGTALAAPAAPQVTIEADYANINYSGLGNVNTYGGALGAEFPLGTSAWSVQIDGNGHGLSGAGGSASRWGADGAVTWNAPAGRVGAAVAYDGISAGGTTLSIVTYGAYGDWFANKSVTLGVKAGGISVSGGGASATQGYVGGHVVIYPIENFALSGAVDYVPSGNAFPNVTSAGVRGEYLFSQKTPFSAYLGYDYVDFSGLRANVFSVGVRYRFGAPGASLEERQRTGVDEWGPAATNGLRLLF